MLLHLGPNVITFRTLLHLGQLLHLGLQQTPGHIRPRSSAPSKASFATGSGPRSKSPQVILPLRSVSSQVVSPHFKLASDCLAPKSSVSSQVVSPLVKFASGRLGQSANFSFGAQLNVISW